MGIWNHPLGPEVNMKMKMKGENEAQRADMVCPRPPGNLETELQLFRTTQVRAKLDLLIYQDPTHSFTSPFIHSTNSLGKACRPVIE